MVRFTITWDVVDQAFDPVPAGVYSVTLELGDLLLDTGPRLTLGPRALLVREADEPCVQQAA